MNTKVIEQNGHKIAVVDSTDKLIIDTQSALDFIVSIKYETGCERIAINKGAISEDFFILSTCLAGEILQKFINYSIKFAVFGDFTKYTSKPLKDFIYECNNGNHIFFVPTQQDAIDKLSYAR